MNDVLTKIRKLIRDSNKSYSTLARESGIPMPTLTHWMYYSEAHPSAANIILLCTYFNVSADWLLGLKETK